MNSHEKRQRAQLAAAVVGVDAGKFHHALVVRPRGGADSKPFTFKVTRQGFEAAAERILALAPGATPAEVLVGIEFAGSYGLTLAHYLAGRGFQVVSVMPSDTKKWKEVAHHQHLKTDQADALGITDLVATGHFVTFAFLGPAYAELRHLTSTWERFSVLRRGAITRLKSTLDVVFPEFETVFPDLQKKTPLVLLRAYPGPQALLAAPKRPVLALLQKASRNHLGEATYDQLMAAARTTLALPRAQTALASELPLLIEQIALYDRHLAQLKAMMIASLAQLPEAEFLLTIPKVKAVTAAVFLGSIGDPRAYESSRQALRVGGLSLVEDSSGLRRGKPHLSKRGRPTLRRMAYMFALRSVQAGGIFEAQFQHRTEKAGAVKMKVLIGLMRSAVKLWFRIAYERRPYVAVHDPRGAGASDGPAPVMGATGTEPAAD